MKIRSLMFGVLVSFSAFAGQGGNGGDVVVCYNEKGEIKKMEAYDFWNASHKYNLNITTDEKTPYMEQFKKSMERLKAIDPVFAKTLLDSAEVFSPESIKAGKVVGLVPGISNNGDGVQTVIPSEDAAPECQRQEIQRIASFSIEPLPFEKPFKLTKSLWNKADEGTKFAIVQHEVIYKHFAKELEEKDSVKVQLFNAFISSEEFLDVTPLSYVTFIRDLDLSQISGFSVKYKDVLFSVGSLNRYKIQEGIFSGKLFEPYSFNQLGALVTSSEIEFSRDGKVFRVVLAKPTNLLMVNGEVNELISDTYFDQEGRVFTGVLNKWIPVKLGGNTFWGGYNFSLYTDGTFSSVHMAICKPFIYKGRKFTLHPGEYTVGIDKNGDLSFNHDYSGSQDKCHQ